MKSLSFFFILLVSLSTLSDARRFNVGGSGAWVPNPPENYESWSGRNRFLVHDTLHFSYARGADSVLEVNKADFDACNTKNPIKKMDDGESEVSLDRFGPFYFISGNEDNCKKGQKIAVVVISLKNSSTAQPPHAAAPGTSPPGSTTPGAHSPKSSSPVSPTTSPPGSGSGSMAPKSGSPVSPTTSPPGSGSMAPKSGSPASPASSPPAPMPPKSPSPSSAPTTSPPGSMSPKSSSPGSPSSAPMNSPPAPMAPESSSPGSYSPVMSPSMAPGESPSATISSPSDSPLANSPPGAGMGPSAGGPSGADITSPAGAPDSKKSSANGMVVMSVITSAISLVLTILLSA